MEAAPSTPIQPAREAYAPSARGLPRWDDHPLFSEDHIALREAIRAWVADRVVPNIEGWEAQRSFPREILLELGSLGYLGLQYPEEYGGQGGDFAANLVLCEELSRVGAESLGMCVGVHTAMASSPILRFGTEEQRQRWLPDMVAGRTITALGISEPDAGSDVAGIRTRARLENGEWIVDGAKTFITNGAIADYVLTVARTSAGSGYDVFSTILVDTSVPGFSVGRKLEKLGRHASDTCELSFDGVRVPEDHLIGVEGRGFRQLMWGLESERIISAATSVALGDYALSLALSYVKERRQFGVPIASMQAVRHELADLAAKLEAARQIVYHAAWGFQNESASVARISMAKLVAARTLNEVADYAVQVHGGYGYMTEYPVGRVWIDARLKRITAGTDEIQREIIARELLGPAGQARR